MFIKFTDHSTVRAAQRNLSGEEVYYVMHYGKQFHKAGALICFLRRRDIPEWDQCNDRLIKLVGTAVILTKDGRTVITVWRNRKQGLKKIKRKPEFDRYSSWEQSSHLREYEGC